MIVYDLQCAAGHRFEGWFDDGDAFEVQKQQGLISCPVCSDVQVFKIPSSFAIKTASSRAPLSGEAMARNVGEYLEKNFDDVGCDFAKEALKIHYGVSEQKNIRGTSTKEEEKLLEKEGVPFFKVPMSRSEDSDD